MPALVFIVRSSTSTSAAGEILRRPLRLAAAILGALTALLPAAIFAQPMSASLAAESEGARFVKEHEPAVVLKLAQELEVETGEAALREYARATWPQLTSSEALGQHRNSLRIFAAALESVIEGEDPGQVFRRSGFAEAGVDPRAWDFYTAHFASRSFVDSLHQQSQVTEEQYLGSLLDQLRPLYLETKIAEKVCAMPAIGERIDGYFDAFYPEEVEVPEPLPGEKLERCRRETRLYALEFARRELEAVAPLPAGWERHFSLLKAWDENLLEERLDAESQPG